MRPAKEWTILPCSVFPASYNLGISRQGLRKYAFTKQTRTIVGLHRSLTTSICGQAIGKFDKKEIFCLDEGSSDQVKEIIFLFFSINHI